MRNKLTLNPRLDLANHSPAGFNWAYDGSGPARLSLAMLAHVTGNYKLAERLTESRTAAEINRLAYELRRRRGFRQYQDFTRRVIATLPINAEATP